MSRRTQTERRAGSRTDAADRDAEALGRYQRFTQALREAGIRAEMFQGNPKDFGRQLKYADRRGFRRIYAGPEHPPYGYFTPGTAHGLGFNDHKVIEVHELMQLVADGKAPLTGLGDAAAIARILDAVLISAAEQRWVKIPGA